MFEDELRVTVRFDAEKFERLDTNAVVFAIPWDAKRVIFIGDTPIVV